MSEMLDKIVYLQDNVFSTYSDFFDAMHRYANPPKDFDEKMRALIQDMEELCSRYLLTISMSDYVKTQRGKEMADYMPRSVEVMHYKEEWSGASVLRSRMLLAIKARRLGAEVVTDVRTDASKRYGALIHHIGTALIPADKDKAFPKEDIEELFKKIEDYFTDKKPLSDQP